MNLKKICDSFFCMHHMTESKDRIITYALEYEIYEIVDIQNKEEKKMLMYQLKPHGCKIVE